MLPEKRLRILMLIPQLGYGGAEGSFLRVANYLAHHAQVTIALMARDYGRGDYCTAGASTDLPVVLLDGEKQVGGSPLAKAARWWRMLRHLRTLKDGHDVAISFLSGANLLNALAGPRAKTVVSERGSKRFDTGMPGLQRALWTRFLDPLTYGRAARIVSASVGLKDEIVSANPNVAMRASAIEGTITSRDLVDAADASVDVQFESFRGYRTIISFGRAHHQKGFDFLLRAFAEVRRTVVGARLLILGDGPELDRLYLLARELGLAAGNSPDPQKLDVVFAGYREKPLRYVQLARVFALTSRYEGLPNALIEALAAGIPVLAADCPWGPRSILAGPKDAVPDGPAARPQRLTHGILMPVPDRPGALEDWVGEMTAALERPVERLSREARRATIARFDIEVTGQDWLRLVQEMTGVDDARARF